MKGVQTHRHYYISIILFISLSVPSVHGAIGLVAPAANKTVSSLNSFNWRTNRNYKKLYIKDKTEFTQIYNQII